LNKHNKKTLIKDIKNKATNLVNFVNSFFYPVIFEYIPSQYDDFFHKDNSKILEFDYNANIVVNSKSNIVLNIGHIELFKESLSEISDYILIKDNKIIDKEIAAQTEYESYYPKFDNNEILKTYKLEAIDDYLKAFSKGIDSDIEFGFSFAFILYKNSHLIFLEILCYIKEYENYLRIPIDKNFDYTFKETAFFLFEEYLGDIEFDDFKVMTLQQIEDHVRILNY